MITVIVEFELPKSMSVDEAPTTFLTTAPKDRAMPGLIRKYYFLSEDGCKAGASICGSRDRTQSMFTPRIGEISSAASMGQIRR